MRKLNGWSRLLRAMVSKSAFRKRRPQRVQLQVERLEQREVPAAIPTPPFFQNPFMAPNNFSEIHLNSQQTDTFSVAGRR